MRHEDELHRDMIVLRISVPKPLIFVAAPSYLAQYDMPRVPDDLAGHHSIAYRHTSSGALHRWECEVDGKRFARAVPVAFATKCMTWPSLAWVSHA